jgi:NADPH:quinone reductase
MSNPEQGVGMRVVQVTRFGPPDVLAVAEAPDPVAGEGQVVIRVSAIDVLFVDTRIRAGEGGEYFKVRPPYVPGNGVAGEVIAAGQDVDEAWIGRRVVTRTGGAGGHGGYAERVAVPVDGVLPVPDRLGSPEAAALLHDGVTGMGLIEAARIRPGEWVLITAAGGGMGLLLVQLAAAAGGRVIGAARGKRKLDLVEEVGAEITVDYSAPGWTQKVREATGSGAKVVLDGVGGAIGREAFEVTANGGRFSAHGAPGGGFTEIDPGEAERRGVTVRGIRDVQFGPADVRRLLERGLREAATGGLWPVIGQTFPLERAADAHAAIEAREVTGKTLLLTGEG